MKKLTITGMLQKHFEDDAKNFKRLDERSDRIDALLGQMGEHLSHLRKDMSTIASTQEVHAKESKEWRQGVVESLKELKTATAPLIKQREDQIVVDKKIASLGTTVRNIAGFIIAVGTIISACIYGLKKIL